MNLTAAQGGAVAASVIKQVEDSSEVDVVICPPFLAIPSIREQVRTSSVKLGAQNCMWLDSGAFTGQVSPKQLHEFCVDYCIVGHSETRGRFGKLEIPESTTGSFHETDETVNLKIKRLLYYGINPILCVGETKAERDAGQTETVIASQLAGALEGIDPAEMYQFVVAYEPVWAIGTGRTPTLAQIAEVHAALRAALVVRFGIEGQGMRLLYGGSVKPSNAAEIFVLPEVDGALVGGASLKASDFGAIVAALSAAVV